MLELIELKHNYGDVTALDGLSFVVQDGEMLGFVGPNGAGKTTAMRVILGLLEPSSGEVRWRGQEITEEVRRRFGYMPEERGLYPKMRVKDHLVYLALISGLDERTAPKELSSGLIDWASHNEKAIEWRSSHSATNSEYSLPRRSFTNQSC